MEQLACGRALYRIMRGPYTLATIGPGDAPHVRATELAPLVGANYIAVSKTGPDGVTFFALTGAGRAALAERSGAAPKARPRTTKRPAR
jgi:hypothetical protein